LHSIPAVQNERDTDDEAYKTDISSSDESDESEESSIESLGKSEVTQNRPRLTSSESLESFEKSGDEHTNDADRIQKLDTNKNSVVESDSDIAKSKEAAIVKRKSNGDGDVVKTKRSKVESTSTDDDSGNATSGCYSATLFFQFNSCCLLLF